MSQPGGTGEVLFPPGWIVAVGTYACCPDLPSSELDDEPLMASTMTTTTPANAASPRPIPKMAPTLLLDDLRADGAGGRLPIAPGAIKGGAIKPGAPIPGAPIPGAPIPGAPIPGYQAPAIGTAGAIAPPESIATTVPPARIAPIAPIAPIGTIGEATVPVGGGTPIAPIGTIGEAMVPVGGIGAPIGPICCIGPVGPICPIGDATGIGA